MDIHNDMHFHAKNMEDIKYYLKSIADIKGLKFDTVEKRFGIAVIQCSKDTMGEDQFNKIVEDVLREKHYGKIDYYDDPVGGARVTIS